MFVSKKINSHLESMATKHFNQDYSIVVDFLFYIFDRFSYDEKKKILEQCPLMIEKRKKIKNLVSKGENIDVDLISEEIKIDIHPLLEERLVNLVLECDKLQTISDAIEFLIFVRNLIDNDLIQDLIIQYSIESIQFSDFSYLNATNPEAYESPSPLHSIPSIPDKTQFLLN